MASSQRHAIPDHQLSVCLPALRGHSREPSKDHLPLSKPEEPARQPTETQAKHELYCFKPLSFGDGLYVGTALDTFGEAPKIKTLPLLTWVHLIS